MLTCTILMTHTQHRPGTRSESLPVRSAVQAEASLHVLLDPILKEMNIESTHLIVAAVAELAGVAAEGAANAKKKNKQIAWLAGHIANQLRATEGQPLSSRVHAVVPWDRLFPHLLNVNYDKHTLEWDIDYNTMVRCEGRAPLSSSRCLAFFFLCFVVFFVLIHTFVGFLSFSFSFSFSHSPPPFLSGITK